MQVPELNRRDFTKLAAAALSGMVAGASLVRADDEPKKKDPNKPLLLQEPHICRGLNPRIYASHWAIQTFGASLTTGP